MPCWNSAHTLPRALASLKAQTYPHWECIVVDDGSTDNPETVVAAAADARLRYIRLDRNRGRGASRQIALDAAKGDLVAMLDADDWFYPWKLRLQVETMLQHPELMILSTGMAIVDHREQLCGVRLMTAERRRLVQMRMSKLGMPPVAFAPSMLRVERARKIGFDVSYSIAEDVDFLLRFMLGQQYGILPHITYVYTEHSSITVQKVHTALGQTRRMFSSYRTQYPVSSQVNILKAAGKQALYRIGWYAGLWGYMVRRRSANALPSDLREFGAAWMKVASIKDAIEAGLRDLPYSNRGLVADTSRS
jgi:glycosyltransferase involved in cell wall biosynthesis